MPAVCGMDTEQDLLECARRYGKSVGHKLPTISGHIFRDSRTLDRLAAGGSLTVRNYHHAMRWLSTHWPDDAQWPDGVTRPAAEQVSV
jgi:hypothetical protein